MAKFDPSKPIEDATVWFPKGMFISNKTRKTFTATVTEDEDDKTFILNHDKMVALGRFLWTGKLLPTDRETYVKVLGLTDTEAMSDKIWAEVDSLLGTYKEVSKGCTDFKDVTWNGLVTLSGKIKTYATLAGGTGNSSYYQAMLEWIRDYNDELDKPNPDQQKLDDFAKSIQGAITQEEKKITDIQGQIKEAVDALNQFHDDCKRYQSTLQGDGETLKSLLEDEGNDIESLNAKIADEMADIATLQSEIDADRQKIKETAYYVWIGFIGAIAAVTVDILTEADIKRLKEKMQNIQDMLDENQAKLKTAIRLSSDIQSMGTQVTDLLNVIAPAIETLEALQGAWAEMSADLTTLYDLFEDDKQTIPPMLLGEKQLATIVDAWNDLKNYADEYIQHAFMTSDPEKITIQDYVKQLDDLTR